MVFGTFDGLHEGHRYFLSEARKLGDYLVVVVAHDRAVRELKNREPKQKMEERVAALTNAALADEVVIGDEVQGSWEVLTIHQPDVVAIGHDQHTLKKILEGKGFSIVQIDIHSRT